MKACAKKLAALSAYLDGQLGREEAAQLETHLIDCAGCRETLAAWRNLGKAMKALPEPKIPASFYQGVWRRIESRTRTPIFTFKAVASLAALLVIVMAAHEY